MGKRSQKLTEPRAAHTVSGNSLVVTPEYTVSLSIPTTELIERTLSTERDAKAENTHIAYKGAAKLWNQFIKEIGSSMDSLHNIPIKEKAEDALQGFVCLFAQWLYENGRKLSTVNSRVYSVVSILKDAVLAANMLNDGKPLPAMTVNTDRVSAVLKGLARAAAKELNTGDYSRKRKQAKPVTNDELYSAIRHIDTTTLQGKRDKVLLLIGRHGAFRRSELVGLNVEDVQITHDAISIEIHGTKTSKGQTVSVCIGSDKRGKDCPVLAYRNYIEAAQLTEGAIFRYIDKGGTVRERLSAYSVGELLKKRLRSAAFDATGYSAHSLRSGFATEAAQQGISLSETMSHGRWTKTETVMGYVRMGHDERSTLTNRMRRK